MKRKLVIFVVIIFLFTNVMNVGAAELVEKENQFISVNAISNSGGFYIDILSTTNYYNAGTIYIALKSTNNTDNAYYSVELLTSNGIVKGRIDYVPMNGYFTANFPNQSAGYYRFRLSKSNQYIGSYQMFEVIASGTA